jgi:hypothetical protein
LDLNQNSIKFSSSFYQIQAPNWNLIFMWIWLTYGQSAQYKSCLKYSNLPSCKISHFSEIPIISPIFILSCWFIQLEKEFKIEKSSWAVFSAPDPALHWPPSHSHARSQPVTARTPQSLMAETRLLTPSSSNSPPLLHARMSSLAKFPSPRRPHVECSHHPNADLSTYRREPSHHLLVLCSIVSTLPTALLPPVAAPAGMPVPGARRRSLAPPAPLAELMWLKARHLGCNTLCYKNPNPSH